MLYQMINTISDLLRAIPPCRRLVVAGPLLWFALVLGAVEFAAAETEKPIEIGSRLELFVDRLLVERMDGVAFRLHPPRRLPLAQSPFNDFTPGQSPYGVGKDGQPQFVRSAYATVIKDGIHWKTIDPRPVIVLDPPEEAFDSQNVAFWSEAEGLYVCYFRSACAFELIRPN